MARWKVFYYHFRDDHRLLTCHVNALTVWGVCREFLKKYPRGSGNVYLSAIKVKMPIVKETRK